MTNWMTATELSTRYMVGEKRLNEFASRGNLPFRRTGDGGVLYDESVAARFFRPRGASSAVTLGAANLGVLGMTRLGEADDAMPMTARQRSRRAAHAATVSTGEWIPSKAAG
jgi:hypothetical protein